MRGLRFQSSRRLRALGDCDEVIVSCGPEMINRAIVLHFAPEPVGLLFYWIEKAVKSSCVLCLF